MSADGKPVYARRAVAFAMIAGDIWSNPKIATAGPHAALVFIFALTRNAVRGRLGFLPAADMTPAYVARQLGLSLEDAAKALQACEAADLLARDEDGDVLIVGWDEEWKRSMLTEAERVRKAAFREKKKRDQRESKRVPDAVPDMSRTGSLSLLPLDFSPNSEAQEKARALGVDLDAELEKFRLTARSKALESADWQAELIKWVIRAGEYQRKQPTTSAPVRMPSLSDGKREKPRRVEELRDTTIPEDQRPTAKDWEALLDACNDPLGALEATDTTATDDTEYVTTLSPEARAIADGE